MNKTILTRHLASDNTLSFYSFEKKSKYNQTKLFESLSCAIKQINVNYTCHLSTYPYIAVHVVCGDVEKLKENCMQIKKIIDQILNDWHN